MIRYGIKKLLVWNPRQLNALLLLLFLCFFEHFPPFFLFMRPETSIWIKLCVKNPKFIWRGSLSAWFEVPFPRNKECIVINGKINITENDNHHWKWLQISKEQRSLDRLLKGDETPRIQCLCQHYSKHSTRISYCVGGMRIKQDNELRSAMLGEISIGCRPEFTAKHQSCFPLRINNQFTVSKVSVPIHFCLFNSSLCDWLPHPWLSGLWKGINEWQHNTFVLFFFL